MCCRVPLLGINPHSSWVGIKVAYTSRMTIVLAFQVALHILNIMSTPISHISSSAFAIIWSSPWDYLVHNFLIAVSISDFGKRTLFFFFILFFFICFFIVTIGDGFFLTVTMLLQFFVFSIRFEALVLRFLRSCNGIKIFSVIRCFYLSDFSFTLVMVIASMIQFYLYIFCYVI